MHSAIEFPQFWEEKHFSLKELYLTRAPGENDSSDNVGKRFPSLVFNLQIKEARLEKTRKNTLFSVATWFHLYLETFLLEDMVGTSFSSHKTFGKVFLGVS